MRTRRIIATVLAIAALPLVILGLIDPLEGGLSLLGALMLVLVARALARVAVPKLAWIAGLATIVIGAATLAIAIFSISSGPQVDPGTAMARGGGILPVLNWIYRVGVVIALAGVVVYVIRLSKSLRAARQHPTPAPEEHRPDQQTRLEETSWTHRRDRKPPDQSGSD